MKMRPVIILLVVVGLLAAMSWAAAAQAPSGSGDPRHAPAIVPALSGSTDGPKRPPDPEIAGPRRSATVGSPAGPAGAAVDLGQPGLSYRYVQTLGETLMPYVADNDHLFRPWGVTVDASGNVYITEGAGHRLMKFTAGGTFLMSIGQAGVWLADNSSRIAGPHGVTVDGGGNIWIVEYGASRVSKWDAAGNYVSQLGQSWNPGSDNSRFRNPTGIARDGTGRLYIADNNNHRVQIFDGAGSHVATRGTGSCGTANDQLCTPQGLAVDSSDRLYVADQGNERVQIFDADGSYLRTLGTTGMCGQANDQFCGPAGVAIGPDGKVYISDSRNSRVQIFAPYPALTYAATLGLTGQWGSDNAHLGFPIGVAVDAGGNIYVAEEDNNRVQVFDSSRNYVRTFGVTGVPYLTDNLHFNNPIDAALDAAGNLVVLEASGQRLVKLDAGGAPQLAIGSPGNPGWGVTYGFSWPNAIATDAAGRIYVADSGNSRIQIYRSDGAYLATVGTGYGTGNAQFKNPQGVAVGSNGYLYVADTENHRIQVFDSGRSYIATIGQAGVAGTDNGHFNRPMRPALDQAGNLYVADAGNLRVQKCTPAGACTTFAGVTGEYGSDFGRFSEPDGVAVDSQGRVYVVDQHNGRVQVYDQSGAYLTTIGGSRGTAPGQNQNPMAVEVDAAGNVYIVDGGSHRIQKYAPGTPGWRQVNINGFGDFTNGNIHALASFGDYLYAGTFNDANIGAQLWRMDAGGSWTQPIAPGFGITRNIGINHLAVFGDRLYAAFRNDEAGAHIYRSEDGSTWDPVVTDGFGSPEDVPAVYRFAAFKNQLYAGTASWTEDHGGEIWRSPSGDSGTWERVVSGGFDDPDNYIMRSSEVHNGRLYFGTQNVDTSSYMTTTGGIVIATGTGADGEWSKVTLDGFGDANNHMISGLASFNGYLYASTSRWDASGSQVWRCQECDSADDWQKVVEDGFDNPQNGYLSTLYTFDGRLYLLLGNASTGMEVWRTSTGNSSDWEQVGWSGFGDSHNYAPYPSNVAELDGRLYMGTQNGANGGEIWVKTLTAGFAAAPARGAPPLAVTFTNTSTGDFTTSQWDFGDGATSTETNPTHTYSAVGTYTVELTVGDGTDINTVTRSNAVRVGYASYLPLIFWNFNPNLYDDFNDPAWDGSWDPALWSFCCDPALRAEQHDGVMVFPSTPPAAVGGASLITQRPTGRTLQQLGFFEARLKMSSDRVGGWSDVGLVLYQDPLAGHPWMGECRLYGSATNAQAAVVCNVRTQQGDAWQYEYASPQTAVDYDTWHTVRIETDPGTAALRFFLDGGLLGSHTPSDAAALKASNRLSPRIEAFDGDTNASSTRYVDDVRITPAR